jgi:hypothetical protein
MMDADEKLGLFGTAVWYIGSHAMVVAELFGIDQPVPDAAWLLYAIGFGWVLSFLVEGSMRHDEPIFSLKRDPPILTKALFTIGVVVAFSGLIGFLIAPLFTAQYNLLVYSSLAALYVGCWTTVAGLKFDPDSPSIYDEPEQPVEVG